MADQDEIRLSRSLSEKATKLRAEGYAEVYVEAFLEAYLEGYAEGRAEAIVKVLESRRIANVESVRERVVGCRDLDTLGVWLDRSITATCVDDLFVESVD